MRVLSVALTLFMASAAGAQPLPHVGPAGDGDLTETEACERLSSPEWSESPAPVRPAKGTLGTVSDVPMSVQSPAQNPTDIGTLGCLPGDREVLLDGEIIDTRGTFSTEERDADPGTSRNHQQNAETDPPTVQPAATVDGRPIGVGAITPRIGVFLSIDSKDGGRRASRPSARQLRAAAEGHGGPFGLPRYGLALANSEADPGGLWRPHTASARPAMRNSTRSLRLAPLMAVPEPLGIHIHATGAFLLGLAAGANLLSPERYTPTMNDILRPAIWLGTRMAVLGFACGVVYSVGGLIVDAFTTGLNRGTALAFGALVGMPILFGAAGFTAGALGGAVVVGARVLLGDQDD